MPYKDPITRRNYGREAQRRYRATHAVPKLPQPPTAHAVLPDYEYQKQWRAQNPQKQKAYHAKYRASHPRTAKNRQCEKNYKLVQAYGITVEDYSAMLQEQNGRCAICGKSAMECIAKGHRHLHVDHDHETKAVRGLLCGKCNSGIGAFADDPELLEKAIEYLRRNPRAN